MPLLAAIQVRLGALDNRISHMVSATQRSHNASATQLAHTLVIPLNATNQVLPAGIWVPQTLGDLLINMDGVQARALMLYYDNNAHVPHQISLRRRAVADHLGVRLL